VVKNPNVQLKIMLSRQCPTNTHEQTRLVVTFTLAAYVHCQVSGFDLPSRPFLEYGSCYCGVSLDLLRYSTSGAAPILVQCVMSHFDR
jgi:hypothetical protein